MKLHCTPEEINDRLKIVRVGQKRQEEIKSIVTEKKPIELDIPQNIGGKIFSLIFPMSITPSGKNLFLLAFEPVAIEAFRVEGRRGDLVALVLNERRGQFQYDRTGRSPSKWTLPPKPGAPEQPDAWTLLARLSRDPCDIVKAALMTLRNSLVRP